METEYIVLRNNLKRVNPASDNPFAYLHGLVGRHGLEDVIGRGVHVSRQTSDSPEGNQDATPERLAFNVLKPDHQVMIIKGHLSIGIIPGEKGTIYLAHETKPLE